MCVSMRFAALTDCFSSRTSKSSLHHNNMHKILVGKRGHDGSIKDLVKVKMDEMRRKAKEKCWTEFIAEVTEFLITADVLDEDAVDGIAGIIQCGITGKPDLVDVAGTPPDKLLFNSKLTAEGVPADVCELLFQEFVGTLRWFHLCICLRCLTIGFSNTQIHRK